MSQSVKKPLPPQLTRLVINNDQLMGFVGKDHVVTFFRNNTFTWEKDVMVTQTMNKQAMAVSNSFALIMNSLAVTHFPFTNMN